MRQTLHFIGQMARHSRRTGAVVPSSCRLARAMVHALGPLPPAAMLIELGAGSGAITGELLARPGLTVVAVESNPAFAARLRQACPSLAVVEGCASRLPEHLAALGIAPAAVHAVLSGLPFLSLPDALVAAILDAVRRVLVPGRRFVPFTYCGRAFRRLPLAGFRLLERRRVWWNLPPAQVYAYERTPD